MGHVGRCTPVTAALARQRQKDGFKGVAARNPQLNPDSRKKGGRERKS